MKAVSTEAFWGYGGAEEKVLEGITGGRRDPIPAVLAHLLQGTSHLTGEVKGTLV